MPLPSHGVHKSPVRGLPKTYSPTRIRSNVGNKGKVISEEDLVKQISLGDGPVKSMDCSSNAPVGDFEVEHEHFVMDVGKMAKEHRERQRLAREAEEMRIKKFRQSLKSRLSDPKHVTKVQMARQKEEEKRRLYEKKKEVLTRDWSKAAKEPAPRITGRRNTTKPPLMSIGMGGKKKGARGGSKTPKRTQVRSSGAGGDEGAGGENDSNVIPSINVLDVSPMVGNKSVVNIEVPAVDWGGDARGRLLKFKKK